MPTSQPPALVDHDSHAPRTHTCGDLREAHIGSRVTLKGWVDTRRDLGGVIFLDLRDRYGLTQVVLSPQDNQTAYHKAERLRAEWVVSIEGEVTPRSAETVNARLATGAVEVRVTDLLVLNQAEAPPFTVSAHEEKQQATNEDLRLKYRYLDLRRPALQNNLLVRSKTYQAIRRYFDANQFVEVETPVLMKSTPEGARDYLVPSRLYPGQFYALPQSPQTYKQILMVAGLDRYFQIVKCFRDEDLRADRQPEFTQVDVEMTFATEEQMYALVEGAIHALWHEVKGIDLPLPFPRLSYAEAMTRYGSDKPDLRFDLPIETVTSTFEGSGFRVFDQLIAEGGEIVALRVPGAGDFGRGQMDRIDKQVVRQQIGAGGLIYFRLPSSGEPIQSSVKENVLPVAFVESCCTSVGADAGDLVLVLAGKAPKVYQQMGQLRLHMADEMQLIPEGEVFKPLWVTEFPLLEWDDETQRYYAMHHPFTSPHPEDFSILETEPGRARARAYDLVMNGNEIGGGSIRIHQESIQERMFALLGIDRAEAEQRFGFLLGAFRYGAPPHGGIALGLDRIVMQLCGTSNIRDVIAFPKTQRAQETMVQSPDVVDDAQLKELHLRVVYPPEKGTPGSAT